MFNIYFRNEELRYYRPIHKYKVEEVMEIIALYRYIVPNILVTDSNDFTIFETNKSEILHFEKETLVDVENALSKSLNFSSNKFDFNYLINLYKQKQEELKHNNNVKIKAAIRDLDMKLLAITANNNIDLTNYTYINSEIFIDSVEDANILNRNDMSKLFKEFAREIDEGNTLVIMPISRVIFDNIFKIDKFVFFPPNSIDFEDSLIISESLFNNELRTLASELTNFTIDTLYQSHCVAFTYSIDWESFQSHPHTHDDITLLKILSSNVDNLFNLIRFYQCKLHLPDTLPGEVGSWSDSLDYLGALLYNKEKENKKAYLIAGSAVESTKVVKGLGLDMNGLQNIPYFYEAANEEMLQIIKNSLNLLSDAMRSHNSTIKFTRVMTLFEYMAYPFEYKGFQEVKKYIICHCADSNIEYQRLSARFQELSQNYRTDLIHNGSSIEKLIPSHDDRNKFFIEIEHYCKKTINAMLSSQGKTWDEFIIMRKSLIENLH